MLYEVYCRRPFRWLAKNLIIVVGGVYFVDELVDVDRVECFGHVESGEDCYMRGFFLLKPVCMV